MPIKKAAYPSQILMDLENMIDIDRDPFSFPGSRLVIKGFPDRLQLQIASRVPAFSIAIEPGKTITTNQLELLISDGKNTALSFSIHSYPHLLSLASSMGIFQVAYRDTNTLGIGLPDNQKCGMILRFSSEPDIDRPEHRGTQQIQALSLAATCPLERFIHKLPNHQYEIFLSVSSATDDSIQLHLQDQDQSKTMAVPFSTIRSSAEKRWRNWFESIPEITNQYRKQYYYAWWVLANNLVGPGGYLTHPAVMPSKAKYIGVWNWDTCFHAAGLRHLDPQLARDQLRLILDHQLDNGMLPDAVHDHGIVDWIDHPIEGEVTKPPLMAWAALKIHELDPDPGFLEEIYPALCRWNRWWYEGMDNAGIPQYHHPYSSGLDDSPLWDHPFPITSPDLAAYLIVQMQSLSAIARILNKTEQAADWQKQAVSLTKLVQKELFDPETGYFYAKTGRKKIDECTPFNYLPIWTNLLPEEITKVLVRGLNKGGEFWKNLPLQTVSSSSENFQPDVMWRGPIWININYLFIEAFQKIGEDHLAEQLLKATLDLVDSNQGIFEYYNPQTGAPPNSAAPIFSWSAALFIDLVLQDNNQNGNQ
jgi:glycogen debranching enzyme